MGACSSSSSSSTSSSSNTRLVLTRECEQRYHSQYQIFQQAHADRWCDCRCDHWDVFLLHQLAKEKPGLRRDIILQYRFRPPAHLATFRRQSQQMRSNTLVAILIQRVYELTRYQFHSKLTERGRETAMKEFPSPVEMKEILSDFVINLRRTSEIQQQQQTKKSNGASSTTARSDTSSNTMKDKKNNTEANKTVTDAEADDHIFPAIHCYRDQRDTDETPLASLIEIACQIDYTHPLACALLPEIAQLAEYFLATTVSDHPVIDKSSHLLVQLIQHSSAAGVTILPLIQVLRRYGLSVMVGEPRSFWSAFILDRHIEEIQLFIHWILFELNENLNADFATVFPLNHASLKVLRERKELDECARVFGEVIDRVNEYRQVALELQHESSSSSKVLPSPSSLRDSFISDLNTLLDILPSRLFPSMWIQQLLAIAPTTYSERQDVQPAFKKVLEGLQEKIMEEMNQPTSVSSSSPSSSCRIHLTSKSSGFSLLKCLIGLKTPLLRTFAVNPLLYTWFLSELDLLQPEFLIQQLGLTVASKSDKRIICYPVLSILLTQHRPRDEGDFIHTIYRKLFHLAFQVYHYKEASKRMLAPSSSSTSPTSRSLSLSTTASSFPRYLPSPAHMNLFLSSGGLRHVYHQLTTGMTYPSLASPMQLIQMKLVVDILEEVGLIGEPVSAGAETHIDFYSFFLNEVCNHQLLQLWKETMGTSTDLLYPTRLPQLSSKIHRTMRHHSTIQESNIQEPKTCARFNQEEQRWHKEIWPRFEEELNVHLISDLSSIVISYLKTDTPLKLSFTPHKPPVYPPYYGGGGLLL